MKITEIIKDIFDDIDATDKKHEDFLRESGTFRPRYRARRDNFGFFVIILPNLIGFAVGLAFARLFELSGSGYIVLGAICALAAGTYKSVSFDKISLKPALIRNVIIIGLFCIVFGFVLLIDK